MELQLRLRRHKWLGPRHRQDPGQKRGGLYGTDPAAAVSRDPAGRLNSFGEGTCREAPISVKEPAVLNAVKKLAVLEKDGQTVQLVLKGNVYLEERAVIYDLTEAETVAVKPRGRRKSRKAET